MKVFNMTAKEFTPCVSMDGTTGKIEIAGRACPEDANRFYKPIFNWMEKYLVSPQPKTILNLRISYLNTSSTKKIVEFLIMASKLEKKGFDLEINWFYNKCAYDILRLGMELSSFAEVKFKFVTN